ncbi:hypothetical protein NG20_03715 [Bacillus subtilis]|uniref:sce7726 family protein n=1 Tax=Bacillus subtilis group TaxID=653685 RepID=UPI000627902C|nr:MULTISPECIES: sce7726 family protein [Bacillus subtilis group]KKJ82437.1 hypothetical protein NG20_03715 [Bacillus subtilis]MCY9088952.1 sce7726 family protein [Bacillus inaquosorum]
MYKLKDIDLRRSLLDVLYTEWENEQDTRIVNEMGILYGKSRVDVAVINGIRHGYEIKSESDTLIRLPSQISHYNLVFNRMTIVVSKNYLDQVKELVPKWWGIIVVYNNKGIPRLKRVRKGRENKKLDPMSISQLLWKEEALDILKEKGLQRGYLSKPKNAILNYLAESLGLEELQQEVNSKLKQRENWITGKQHIQGDDLHLQ